MKNKLLFYLLLILITISYLLVFRSFFMSGILAFGDSPNFSLSLIKTYFGIPQIWRARGGPLGNISLGDLVLSLIMFFYGILGKVANLNSFILMRIFFLFPATICALFGSYLLAGVFIENKISRLLCSFFYTFNTYFLLLLDGGQVGVAFGYGLSPFIFWSFLKIYQNFTWKNFLITFILFWILTNIEIRFAAILLIAFIFYHLGNVFSGESKGWLKKILFLVPVVIFSLILDSFWLIPIIFSKTSLPNFFAELGVTNLAHSLLLFQPQWPVNEFGHIIQPSIIYYFLPLLLFIPIFIKKDKNIFLIIFSYLFFTFLSKGTSAPLGNIYNLILKIPFGNVFRDSTKFFLPALIFAAILTGLASQTLMEKFKKFSFIFPIIIISYLFLLIYPALSGKLTGLLSWQKGSIETYENINKEVAGDNNSFRYLFFPARPAYVSESYPAEILDASQLYKLRPFATLIEGVYDKFYFLWDPLFPKLLDFIGTKKVFFTPDLRKKTYSQKEIVERQQFLDKVALQSFGEIENNSPFPIFERKELTPKIFSVQKVVLVIGGDDIYKPIFGENNLRFDEYPIIFAEDGIWPIEDLLKIKSDALNILFYNKEANDLIYRILAEGGRIDLENLKTTKWGVANQVIDWRYEAEKGGVVTHDFDLGRGVIFSNISGEKAEYIFSVKDAGEKNFVIRGIGNNARVKVAIDNVSLSETKFRQTDNFTYQNLGKINLKKGQHKLTVENISGFSMVNFIEYFSDEEYGKAQVTAEKILETFPNIMLGKVFPNNFQEVNFSQISPTKYQVDNPNGEWIILTENYNSGWKLDGNAPFPIFSFVNGFYLAKTEGLEEIYFEPQNLVLLGIKISLAGFAIIFVGQIIIFLKRREIEKYLN